MTQALPELTTGKGINSGRKKPDKAGLTSYKTAEDLSEQHNAAFVFNLTNG
ncbi:hypothetical protein SDC9_24375 [bioreactor metagenome]|jgi:hypothetical protein|uniref:Uncharacterized protein n=1 Tax=bioreactor metagenome TaxID=1076179 RepID=A0A644UHM9_9ZZZZ